MRYGREVHFGSRRYGRRSTERTVKVYLNFAIDAGFEATATARRPIPFLRDPRLLSRHRKNE